MKNTITFEIVEYADGTCKIFTKNRMYEGVEGLFFDRVPANKLMSTLKTIADKMNNRYNEGVDFVIG